MYKANICPKSVPGVDCDRGSARQKRSQEYGIGDWRRALRLSVALGDTKIHAYRACEIQHKKV